jgi:hypothetical protein
VKHVARIRKMSSVCKILVGTREWKRPLGRRRRNKLKDKIKINLKQIECAVVDRIHLARDKNQWQVFVNKVMNLQVS